jgi:dTDP-4-dehydrorhamnose reductase
MKVAVVGALGQLGTDVVQAYRAVGHDVVELDLPQVDVVDVDVCRLVLQRHQPDLVVDTAAMHHVENCEKEPLKSFQVNALGARHLAQLSRELGFTLVYVSTDYVFDGFKRSPYTEADHPRPLNVYGNTKLSGEMFVRTVADRYFVVRVSGLYGNAPCRAKGGLNFVKLMLKLSREREEVRVVDTEWIAPTATVDIAHQLIKLTDTTGYGLYHVVSHGGCSWYEFAKKIFELSGAKVRLSVADPGEFPAKVPRPLYSVLENRALLDAGLDVMPHWSDALKRYLAQLPAA